MKIAYHILMEGGREDSFLDGVKTSVACSASSVLVTDGVTKIIVDTGAVGYADKLLASLEALGINPDDVSYVINTHSHQDHVYNNYLFKNALVVTASSVWYPHDGNKVVIYPDITTVDFPLITIIPTPGHMEKHISVLFEVDGEKVVVAGDAIRKSIIEGGVIPKKYADSQQCLESMNKLLAIADIIIPGHGPVVSGKEKEALALAASKFEIL